MRTIRRSRLTCATASKTKIVVGTRIFKAYNENGFFFFELKHKNDVVMSVDFRLSMDARVRLRKNL